MSSRRRHARVTVGALLGVLLLCVLAPASAIAAPSAPSLSWLRTPANFAHALGGLNSGGELYTYTNCLEAFQQNYAKGYRIFELDLALTSDNYLVLRHDWSSSLSSALGESFGGSVPTHSQFMKQKVLGKYTPLDAAGLVKLMRTHPDMYIVTDSKYPDSSHVRAMFGKLLQAMGKDQGELTKRVIVQTYNEPMWYAVQRVYPFKNIIYTLYKTSLAQSASDRAVHFASAHGIKCITFDMTRYSTSFVNEVRNAGIAPAVNTINSEARSTGLRKAGVRFLYSDALTARPYWDYAPASAFIVRMSPHAVPFNPHDD